MTTERYKANRTMLLDAVDATGDGSYQPVAGGIYHLVAEADTWNGAVLTLKFKGPAGASIAADPSITLTANGAKSVEVCNGAEIAASVATGAPTNLTAVLVRQDG